MVRENVYTFVQVITRTQYRHSPVRWTGPTTGSPPVFLVHLVYHEYFEEGSSDYDSRGDGEERREGNRGT